jgi:hypothetical protein
MGPGLWVLQHVCGYYFVGFAPTTDGDVVYLVRNRPVELRHK